MSLSTKLFILAFIKLRKKGVEDARVAEEKDSYLRKMEMVKSAINEKTF